MASARQAETSKPHTRPKREEYQVALICALPQESQAVVSVFDGQHHDYEKVLGDQNSYTTGWIGRHNVVLVHLPGIGKVAAAGAAAHLKLSFPNIRLCLVVGICGGVPGSTINGLIMLGDVVISTGIVQFDFGRQYPNELKRKDSYFDNLARPNLEIRAFLHKLQIGNAKSLINETRSYFEGQISKQDPNHVCYPGRNEDHLYPPEYRHKHHDFTACEQCAYCERADDPTCSIALEANCTELHCEGFLTRNCPEREPPTQEHVPVIHFGSFASGDVVMKSGIERDRIARRDNVIGFEMEGAGVWDTLPTIIVKAVCDYADSHKSKSWQKYAAIVAACSLKAVLNHWSFAYEIVSPPFRPSTLVSLEHQNRCLQSLAFPEMFSRQKQTRDAAAGTCVWLHDHRSYQNWLSQSRGLLWIKGKPGAGKSTLMNYALNALQSTNRDGQVLASFFFDGTGTSLQKSQLGLFRSLLHQILCQVDDLKARFATQFNDRWEQRGTPGVDWEWELKEIQAFLKDCVMTSTTSPHIRIFVDALDESGETNALEIVSYFESLSSSCSTVLDNPSICFSCRHYPTIQLEEDDDLVICVEKENGTDIDTFVRAKLGSKRVFKDETDAQFMANKISEGASGVFQWVVLVIEQILTLVRQRRPLGIILDKIRDTPVDLNTTYQSIFDTFAKEDRRRTLRLFQWICFAKVRLNSKALAWAIELKSNIAYASLEECNVLYRFLDLEELVEEVKRLSGGLVEMSNSIPTRYRIWDYSTDWDEFFSPEFPAFRLIHQSVYDYLVEHGLNYLEHSLNVIGDAHIHLARVSLRLIAANKVEPKPSSHPPRAQSVETKLYPLYWYAKEFWRFHVEEAEMQGSKEADLNTIFDWLADDFFTDDNGYVDRFECFHDSQGMGNANLVHYAARFGIVSLVRAVSVRSTTRSWSDPLMTTSNLGEPPLVFNKTMWALLHAADARGRSPLSIAAQYGQIRVVKELLARSWINPNSQDQKGFTPIHHAVIGRHASGHASVLRELLTASDLDPNAKDVKGLAPLHYGIRSGRLALVRELLASKKIDLMSRDNEGSTPLHDGALYGKVIGVRELLKHGINPNIRDKYGLTPLHLGAESGNVSIVRELLLDDRIDLNVKDIHGCTLLHIAAEYGHVSLVRELLLDVRFDPHTKDLYGYTALHIGAKFGHASIIREFLLNDKTDPNSRDEDGRTPLHYGVAFAHRDVVRELLADERVDVNAVDHISQNTPFSLAVILGHSKIVKVLLASGKVDSVSEDANTRLQASWSAQRLFEVAQFKYYKSISLRIFLTGKVDLTLVQDVHGLLETAVLKNKKDVVRTILLTSNVDLSQRNWAGSTILMKAIMARRDDIAQFLLATGKADTSSPPQFGGRSPLSLAAENGCVKTVQWLLARAPDSIDLVDHQGRSPLFYAARYRKLNIARLLLATGKANPHLRDKYGESPYTCIPLHMRNSDILWISQAATPD